ncbi:MAG TPA: DUF3604 domain-containing protein [Rhodothermia bacterium]
MNRSFFSGFLIGLLALLPAALAGQPRGDDMLTVTPNVAVAGTFQVIRYAYAVGGQGMGVGGGIRIEFPVAYGETESYFWSKPQTDYPDAPGHVAATTSSDAVIRVTTGGIAGSIATADVVDGTVSPGDTLTITYRGIVQSLARDVEVRGQTRPSGDATWVPIERPPVFHVLPREAHIIIVTTPADVKSGTPFQVAVVLIDRFGNLASSYRGSIVLASTDPNGSLPERYDFNEADGGAHVFDNVRFDATGFHRISASDPDSSLQRSSHYAWVSAREPSIRRYFGDTHFHTGSGTQHHGFIGAESTGDINTLATKDFQDLNSGGDHRGNFTDANAAYRYARDVVRLDFASSSEHDAILFDTPAWESSQRISEAFNQPGRFTTFFAYEWTSGFMHHIVLYRNPGAQVFGRTEYPDLVSLWEALDRQARPALTIPHVTWTFADHPIWNDVNNTYRRVGEIYSLWNNRFLVQPDDIPQRFEVGVEDPWSYQNAWRRGHRMGLVGATDNHLGHPGANNYTIYTHHTGGLAVVLAAENTREDLWDGLQSRRTYATTGTRIYLDFRADEHPMGSEYTTDHAPQLSLRVAGTNVLESVEIVKYQGGAYSTIHALAPNSDQAVFEFTDPDFNGDCMYYLRVRQVHEYPGRPWSHSSAEMAWSSPIWVGKRVDEE